MEKICIVKRRKKDWPEEQETVLGFPEGIAHAHITGVAYAEITRESENAEERSVSVQLTPEQSEIILSKDLLCVGVPHSIQMLKEEPKDGRLIFNFHFKSVYTTKMLNTRDACAMLQISRGLLVKITKEGKLQSYKIGRLRRYLLEDILIYLSKSKECRN